LNNTVAICHLRGGRGKKREEKKKRGKHHVHANLTKRWEMRAPAIASVGPATEERKGKRGRRSQRRSPIRCLRESKEGERNHRETRLRFLHYLDKKEEGERGKKEFAVVVTKEGAAKREALMHLIF